MGNQLSSWATMTPAQHLEAAQALATDSTAEHHDFIVASLHVQAAQARASMKLYDLLRDRVQYVDTRKRGV